MIIYDVEQGSKEWYLTRKAKVTGTNFGKLFGADDLKLIDKLIAETVSDEIEDTGYQSEEMMRGQEYEPLARAAFEKDRNVKVDVYGFVASMRYPWLGYSPDGHVKTEDGKHKIGIEIKCPNTSTHVRYIRMNQIPNEYKYQVRLIFLVCPDIEEVVFISYDPRFYKRPMWTISVKREEIAEELKVAEVALIKFRGKFEKYLDQVTF